MRERRVAERRGGLGRLDATRKQRTRSSEPLLQFGALSRAFGGPQEVVARAGPVTTREVSGLEERSRETLLVDRSVLEQQLGEHDHHLRVVGVGAAAESGIEHLDVLRDRARGAAFKRHPKRITYERA